MPDVANLLHDRIIAQLDEIKDPCSLAAGTPFGLSEMGLVDRVDIGAEGDVTVYLRLTSPFCHMIGYFKQDADRRISALEGVRSVTLVADQGLDWSPSRISAAAIQRRDGHLQRMESAAA